MTNKFLTLMVFLTAGLITSCSTDDDGPQGPINITIEGATLAPTVGGPNQPNQVYIDLSTSDAISVRRDAWDLGFYSGTDFRVVINGSLEMAAAELSLEDIDAINSSTQEVIDLQPKMDVGNFDSENMQYVDSPDGSLSETAINEVSEVDANNKVYLVNLGHKVGTETPTTGGTVLSGEARGWMKIRILRDGNDYVLQYADLDETTHNEVTISKNPDYNFTFFSLKNGTVAGVEPSKEGWDLNFTTFTNEVFAGPTSYGAYFYGDFVVSNSRANVGIYMIDTEEQDAIAFENFTFIDVNSSLFTNDQRSIGSSWRNGGGPGTLPSLKENVYYIINDANGNYYKLKFLALTNEVGERGYPQFEYSLLVD